MPIRLSPIPPPSRLLNPNKGKIVFEGKINAWSSLDEDQDGFWEGANFFRRGHSRRNASCENDLPSIVFFPTARQRTTSRDENFFFEEGLGGEGHLRMKLQRTATGLLSCLVGTSTCLRTAPCMAAPWAALQARRKVVVVTIDQRVSSLTRLEPGVAPAQDVLLAGVCVFFDVIGDGRSFCATTRPWPRRGCKHLSSAWASIRA